ncbi:hypothetical protein [Pseudomonas phage vB_PaeM_PS119XW]|uniref:Uncharacterized protein n=1 Tax=Pseudomonas phage vB_PaeM_PS119XW TaxID=2601632 RepID=A0A5C1K8T3_9CAUD|nr:hypothetical protein PP933_gp182 [Pseudomonas phage vB_PaeM_PS119XW]QEM41911.1 hypothetical protein [Pseudomonas phage vB_PaeM_PS119XW]BEG72427.1 hypothetical protein RVBP21_0550 [Pseudomonas phage BRkr]
MSKKYLLVLCLTLSGCVIYAPRYTTQTVVQQETTSSWEFSQPQIKTITEVKERVIQTPVTEQKRPLASCEPFVLPRAALLPEKPNEEELASAQSSEEIDRKLSEYVAELRAYNVAERSKIEQAHQKWLDHCQRKLD